MVLEEHNERVCVVFADMVGYSALSARDEAGTHLLWMDFTHRCIETEGEAHGARIMRLLGDGCLLSFADPAKALAFCHKVRATILKDREKMTPDWPGLSMRFGLHLCDVIQDHGEIYGDGVNTAKRLQERAQSDGILLSQTVHDAIPPDVVGATRYLGALSFRNLQHAVPTFEAILPGANPMRREANSELPSIAVLPFRNQTGEEEFDYFTEGLIDDIIFSLSGLKELQVIARGSTVAFAKRTVDPRDVARILSVRYILQGTIRKQGERLRLSMSFEDAQTGETIFGEKCDFSHRDVFDVQDNIVRKIVARVAPNVRARELEAALRKPAGNFTAYQCTLRALDLMRTLDRKDFLEAKVQLDRAMELDPDFVLPIAWTVRWYTISIGQNWTKDRDGDIQRARDLASKAVSIDRQNPLALAAYGHVKSYLERDYTTALVYFDRARQVGPSHAAVWMLSSATLSYLGKGDEAVEHAMRGIELSPNDYELFQFYTFLCLAYYVKGDYEEAYTWAKLSQSENAMYSSTPMLMAACASALGRKDEAHRHAERLRNLDPDFNMSKYRDICPIHAPALRDAYFGHLEAAGLSA